MLEHFDAYLEGVGNLQAAGLVDAEWNHLSSGNSSNDVRRMRVGQWVIELRAAAVALDELASVALEAASITSVSEAAGGVGQ
jgi:hypothetical protein